MVQGLLACIQKRQGGNIMVTIANYLYAAAESGFYSKDDWQRWADNQILNNEIVEDWIYDVALAGDISSLANVISDKMIDEDYYRYNEFSITDAVIGYYYLLYTVNRMTLYDLITKSGQASDASGQCLLDCEQFYDLLNEIDSNEYLKTDSNFLNRIHVMFKQFEIVAENQKEILEKYL